ncbi:hypothetical protein BJX99DRAFT_117032 [Aspergillus californicus]
MEPTTQAKHRMAISAKWGKGYERKQIKPFKDLRNLCYRNAVILLLLHTPLLINWVEETHPRKHHCGTKDMSLLCSFHYLIHFYWFGDLGSDTYEKCMDRVWEKLLATTWSVVDLKRPQDAAMFLEAILKQLSNERKIDAEKYHELQRFFRAGFTTRLVCKGCNLEKPTEYPQYLSHASFPDIVGAPPPSYEIIQAIRHNLLQATVPWACKECAKSNNNGDSAEPSLSTMGISYLPEILFVQVDYLGHRGQLNGKLILREALDIPTDMQYPDAADSEKVNYELYSIIFRQATEDDQRYTHSTAVRGPTGKWALIETDVTFDELPLDKLLRIVEKKQRGYILAYRRLPLDGLPMRAADVIAIKGAHPLGMSHNDEANGPGVTLNQVISLPGGIEWTVNQYFHLPSETDHFIKLTGKARVQPAELELKFTTATGEIYEGKGIISLKRKCAAKRAESKKTAKSSDIRK